MQNKGELFIMAEIKPVDISTFKKSADYSSYEEISKKGANQKDNTIKEVKLNVDENAYIVIEADGDEHTVPLTDKKDDTVEDKSKTDKTDKTDKAEDAKKKDLPTDVGEITKNIDSIKAEIAKLEEDKKQNNEEMKKLGEEIEKIEEEINADIKKELQRMEGITDEQKKETGNLVEAELSTYKNAEGEMTLENFQDGLDSKLGALDSKYGTEIASITRNLMNAEGKMSKLDVKIKNFSNLTQKAKEIDDALLLKGTELDTMEAQKTKVEADNAKKADPIGFKINGEKFDFFIDKDKDGKLSSECEFLGSKENWSEMEALDSNKDNKITKDEVAGLKMVKTKADGKQEIVDASVMFNDDTDFIELSTYKKTNKDIGEGNTELGVFNVNIDGKEFKTGYNTLDDIGWLDKNYSFSDKEKGIGRFAKPEDKENVDEKPEEKTPASGAVAQLQLDKFLGAFQKLQELLALAWQTLGIRKEDSAHISKMFEEKGDDEGSSIDESNKEKAEIKAEEEKIQEDKEKQKDIDAKAEEGKTIEQSKIIEQEKPKEPVGNEDIPKDNEVPEDNEDIKKKQLET